MKNFFIFIWLLFISISCKKMQVLKKAEIKQAIENEIDNEGIFNSEIENQKIIDNLNKLVPLSVQQYREWMPNKLLNLKLTRYQIGKSFGFSKISSIFLVFNNERKKIEIQIIDGADLGASKIALQQAVIKMNIESQSESGYERIEIFEGQKVLVNYSKPEFKNKSNLKYIVKNRLLIEVTSFNMTPVETWKYLKELKAGKLLSIFIKHQLFFNKL
jgi:hypothetical protein